MRSRSGLGAHLREVLTVPSVWIEALRAGFSIRSRSRVGVSTAYLQWRMYTAYGSHNVGPSGSDLVHYLRWRRHMRKLAGWENAA